MSENIFNTVTSSWRCVAAYTIRVYPFTSLRWSALFDLWPHLWPQPYGPMRDFLHLKGDRSLCILWIFYDCLCVKFFLVLCNTILIPIVFGFLQGRGLLLCNAQMKDTIHTTVGWAGCILYLSSFSIHTSCARIIVWSLHFVITISTSNTWTWYLFISSSTY